MARAKGNGVVAVNMIPDDTAARVRVIDERSRPAQNRPRLSRRAEEILEPIERETAACYRTIEDCAARMHRAARRLEQESRKMLDDVEEFAHDADSLVADHTH